MYAYLCMYQMKIGRNYCDNNYAMYCVNRKKQNSLIFDALQILLVTFATFALSDITRWQVADLIRRIAM